MRTTATHFENDFRLASIKSTRTLAAICHFFCLMLRRISEHLLFGSGMPSVMRVVMVLESVTGRGPMNGHSLKVVLEIGKREIAWYHDAINYY